MKILHVCDWYRPFGGAERLLFGQLDLIEEAGHQNLVIAHDFPDQKRTNRWPEYFVSDVEINFAAAPPGPLLARRIKALHHAIEEVLERHSPDLVHFHNCQNPYVVEMLARRMPSVRSVHDPRLYCFTDWKLLPDRSICSYALGQECLKQGCISQNFFRLSRYEKQAAYRVRHLRAHQAVDVLIVESAPVLETLKLNGFPQSQLALLPNFTRAAGTFEEVERYNAQYYEPGGRIVLFVGRASYEKGLEALVEAMRLVPRPWKLVLVSGGEYLEMVRERVRQLGLEDSVEIPGVQDYLTTRKYYARADVIAFPSVWMESFGLVGLEAMANGKPVVAFRTGGVPEWLEDGRTGLLALLKDVPALAGNIQKLLDDPALAARMGRNGYERVVECFNPSRYAQGLLRIYDLAQERYAKKEARASGAVQSEV